MIPDWAGSGETYLTGTGPLGRHWYSEICTLYVETFSKAPFSWAPGEARSQAARLASMMRSQGFSVCISTTSDYLIGFAYGVAVPIPQQGYIPEAERLFIKGPVFHLTDFAVREGCRGNGVGRRLHHMIIHTRTEAWATVTVQPQAIETATIYQRWGWRKVGAHAVGAAGLVTALDVYVRPTTGP